MIERVRDEGRLFDERKKRTLWKIFADRFEGRYAREIRRANGSDHDEVAA